MQSIVSLLGNWERTLASGAHAGDGHPNGQGIESHPVT